MPSPSRPRAEGPDPEEPRGAGRWLLDALTLCLFWALLHLPHAGLREFHYEEPRRALPAREMLASGDWVVPTIWGRPYLTKPPGYYWAVALLHLGGLDRAVVPVADGGSGATQITPLGVRAPALAATLASALLLWALGVRFLGRSSGWLAAALFLWTPMVLEKGALGETDALFGFFVFAATAAAWIGVRGSRVAALAAGPLLGLALLTKGPAALVFFLAGIAGAWRPGRTAACLRTGALALAVGAALLGVWALAVVARLDLGVAREVWFAEVARGGGGGAGVYLADRLQYLAKLLPSYAPGSLVCLLLLVHRSSRSWLRSEPVRVALWVAVVGAAFFLLYPRARTRYVVPIAPWMALVGGHVLAGAFGARVPAASRITLRGLVGLLGVLGIVGGLAGPWLAAPRGDLTPDAALGRGILAGAALAGAVALVALARGRNRLALACALAVPVLAQTFHLAVLVPARARADTGRARAAELEAAVEANLGPGGRLFTDHWDDFGTLIYLHRPPVFADDPGSTLAPGDLLLARDAPRSNAAAWERVHATEWGAIGDGLVLLRRRSQ